MNKAIPTIAYYSSIGLLTGSILETIMPEFNENKDSVALILEIFAQLTLVVFMFMFINSRGGVRNGLLVFTLSLVGTQPSLFQKMMITFLKLKVLMKQKPQIKKKTILQKHFNKLSNQHHHN